MLQVATVELQINDGDANPALLTAFVVTTALLVACSLMAVMISTCILPHVEAVAKMSQISEVSLSPHENMVNLIDISWVMANTASLFFFTLDVILMCWIKVIILLIIIILVIIIILLYFSLRTSLEQLQ
jgi:hypothetical protein